MYRFHNWPVGLYSTVRSLYVIVWIKCERIVILALSFSNESLNFSTRLFFSRVNAGENLELRFSSVIVLNFIVRHRLSDWRFIMKFLYFSKSVQKKRCQSNEEIAAYLKKCEIFFQNCMQKLPYEDFLPAKLTIWCLISAKKWRKSHLSKMNSFQSTFLCKTEHNYLNVRSWRSSS